MSPISRGAVRANAHGVLRSSARSAVRVGERRCRRLFLRLGTVIVASTSAAGGKVSGPASENVLSDLSWNGHTSLSLAQTGLYIGRRGVFESVEEQRIVHRHTSSSTVALASSRGEAALRSKTTGASIAAQATPSPAAEHPPAEASPGSTAAPPKTGVGKPSAPVNEGRREPGELPSAQAPVEEASNSAGNTTSSNSKLPKFNTSAEAIKVKLNTAADGPLLLYTLVATTFILLVMALMLTLLRRFNPAVYSREGSTGASTLTGRQEGWICQVWGTSTYDEIRAAGVDGWTLLELYRLHIRILTVITLPVLAVIGGAHYTSTEPSYGASPLDILSRFDIGSIPDDSWLFWLHAGFVWLVVCTATLSIKRTHDTFLEHRFHWLQTIPSPRATTVMIQNLPEELRSDRSLQDYFCGEDGLFMRKSPIVLNAYVVRSTGRLNEEWSRLQDIRMAVALASSRSEGCEVAPQGLVDLQKALRLQLRRVRKTQDEVERGVASRDPKVCSASGFVTFSSVLWQRLALQEKFHSDTNVFNVSMPPDPNDVKWNGLKLYSAESTAWEGMGWVSLLLVFVFWSPVVVFITGFTTLANIEALLPPLKTVMDSVSYYIPGSRLAIEGFLAVAILQLFLAFLPSLILLIINRFFHVKAGAWAQLRLHRWYFSFLVIFVLLITTLGRGLIITAASVAKEPVKVVEMLAIWLPKASHFYFNYVILCWMTIFLETLRLSNLFRYWLYRLFYWTRADDSKRFSEPESPGSYGIGVRLAFTMLVSSLTLVFCTASPLMLPLSFAFFGIGRLAYGFLLVHAEAKKPDTGGEFWPEVVRQLFFALLLHIVVMTGTILLHHGQQGPAFVAASSVLVLYIGWRRIHSLEWEVLPLEQMVRAWRAGEHISNTDGAYRQPECIKVECEEADEEAEERQPERTFAAVTPFM